MSSPWKDMTASAPSRASWHRKRASVVFQRMAGKRGRLLLLWMSAMMTFRPTHGSPRRSGPNKKVCQVSPLRHMSGITFRVMLQRLCQQA